jgi:malonyl-CoA O-methyltransferase
MLPLQKAVSWILGNINEGEGIVISNTNRMSYPEVSGYLIPTLLNLGYSDKAFEIGNWLAKIQNPDGSIPLGPNKFTFDTAMVLSGWRELEGFEIPKKKACEFLLTQILRNGKMSVEFHDPYVPEKILLWVVNLLQKEGYDVKRVWDYYINVPNILDFDCLSHFHCYALDACLESPLHDLAIKHIKYLYEIQSKNGTIPAYGWFDWICYTGVAQAALLFYKIGLDAKRQVDYLETVMSEDGGFYGSNGSYFGDQKVSWATKFFIDAYMVMIEKEMDKQCDTFSNSIEVGDSRMLTILNTFKDKDIKVLDVGCGKGRYAKHLIEKGVKVYGIDISSKLLEACDERVTKSKGSATRIPYPKDTFEGAYCIEVLEHSPCLMDNAIKEIYRILKPGGKLIIIDKTDKLVGGKEKWESWFDLGLVKKLMEKYFIDVEAYQLTDIFLVWKGVKK